MRFLSIRIVDKMKSKIDFKTYFTSKRHLSGAGPGSMRAWPPLKDEVEDESSTNIVELRSNGMV